LLESLEERCLLSYQVTDLGTLPGATDSFAHGINNAGQVVGDSGDIFASVPRHAFLWDATNGMQDLGTLPGDRVSQAQGINDAGQVVGSSYITLGGPEHAFLWDATNGMQDLGTLPGDTRSFAFGLNHSGQVVGSSGIAGRPTSHAFLWDAVNGMQDLGTLPGDSLSYATGINASGQVVGASYADFRPQHAFLWDATHGMQDLGTLPGDSGSIARGINNSGQVVGYSESRGEAHRAFLWDAVHGMQDLGNLGRNAYATGINSNGQVVGGSEVYNDVVGDYFYDAFVWQNGTMRDLNDQIPGGSADLGVAYAINDAGQIVADGAPNGFVRAYLLTPDSSALPAPAGTVHFTRSDAQAVLLADSAVTAADAGVHPFSLTLATPGDQTLTGTDTAAARIGRATVPVTSDAAAPAGPTVQTATDALFARSHRTSASVSASGWEVNELELGMSLLPKL
jgi:probable HAF family extracellular repeat protein